MTRAKFLGLGSYVPDRVVTNDELRFFDDKHERCSRAADRDLRRVDPEAHRHRERRYVPNDGTWACSDLALRASQAALEDAGVEAGDVDCIIFATLSPDIHFPGSGGLPADQARHRRRSAPASTSASSAAASSTGCRWPTPSSAPACTSGCSWSAASCTATRSTTPPAGRDVMVLFGTAPARWCSARRRRDDERAGVIYTTCHADGSRRVDLHLKASTSSEAAVPGVRPRRPATRTRPSTRRWTASGSSSTPCAAWSCRPSRPWRRDRPHLGRHRLVRAPPGQPAHQPEGGAGRRDPEGQGAQHHHVLRQHHRRHGAAHHRPLAQARARSRRATASWPRSSAPASPGARPSSSSDRGQGLLDHTPSPT
jgi:hypothetical protein